MGKKRKENRMTRNELIKDKMLVQLIKKIISTNKT